MKIRLSTRLILSVVLIEAVMLTTLVWNSVRLIGSSHAEVLKHHLAEEASMLASLLTTGLAVNDRAILRDALSQVGKEKAIVYATVLDTEGKTMASIGTVPVKFHVDNNYQDARKVEVYDTEKKIVLTGQVLGTLKIGYSIEYVEALIRKTRLQNTTIAAIELVLSVIVTFAVGYFLTRSLRKLEAGAHALARDELDHRIDLDSHDEMGDLARSFNNLAKHLTETRKALIEEHRILEQKSSHLETLMDGVDAVIVEANPAECRYLYVSKEAENLLGYPEEDWLEPDFLKSHMHPEDQEEFYRYINTYYNSPGSYMVDFRMIHRDGPVVDIRSINSLDYDESGKLTCRGLLLDVTEQKQNEKRIAYLADHDALTGLFNRRRFQEELERTLDYAERFKQIVTLIFIDLDQFKYINDTMGHQAGDEYLCAIARRLSGALRKVDVLGRLGGDEFGIILPDTNRAQAEVVARNILDSLLVTNGSLGEDVETPVTASLGIVLYPSHGTDPGNLLAKADAAMYSAKDKGRNTYHVYSDTDQQLVAMHAKLQWEQRIRKALEEDLFELHYQPIYRLDNRTISHYEVLLRMKDGEGGLIPPGAFLGIAERFGMIRDIDRWVLGKAIEKQGESCKTGSPVCLAINLSGRHFGSSRLLEWIRMYIEKCKADPSKLIFEITETAAVENVTQASRFADALHSLGCRLALDDFGVGFSSFQYLKHLPVDMIKLDGSFVRNLARDAFDRVFIRAMSDMARGLGITCIAEFIETEEVIDILLELGVGMGQGYHLARPAPGYTVGQGAVPVSGEVSSPPG